MISFVDWHHVDADPDSTFHFDADPYPDPDPSPSSNAGKSKIFGDFYSQQCQCEPYRCGQENQIKSLLTHSLSVSNHHIFQYFEHLVELDTDPNAAPDLDRQALDANPDPDPPKLYQSD